MLGKKIVFIGPMGAGKTTIGRRIAKHYHLPFYDSDKVIEERTGVSIPIIFELEGEKGFRKRETEVLEGLLQNPEFVLATGGGIVLKPENRNMLRRDAMVIFLSADLDHLFSRTCYDKNRPLLQNDNPKQTLKNILEERLPIYNELADIIIETNHQNINVAVKDIVNGIKNYENA